MDRDGAWWDGNEHSKLLGYWWDQAGIRAGCWEGLAGTAGAGRGTGIGEKCSCGWGILGEIWGMVLRGKGWWIGGLRGGHWGASQECGYILGVLLEGWEGLAAKLGWDFHRMGR